MRRQRVRVELGLDGELRARYEGRYVEIAECGMRPAAEPKAEQAGSQGSQRRRAEPLDGWLLRSAQPAVVEVRWEIEKKVHLEGALFLCPKPQLGGFTKAMDPDRTEPSRRSGNTHGFCVTGGLPPIASEPTPSPRLWATPPGATPAGLCEHTMRADSRPSKPELSTLAGIGTFYFGPTRSGPNATRWKDLLTFHYRPVIDYVDSGYGEYQYKPLPCSVIARLIISDFRV